MRHLEFSPTFEESMAAMPRRKRERVAQTLVDWVADPDDPRVRLCDLATPWEGHFSLEAGDQRIHLRWLEPKTSALVIAAGPHHRLHA
ncbi:MAG: hypothetical protein LBM23_02720 [Propionibacteriaceae bacterium]|jgi:mRNA-degrading endonuclease RelE of RelBE toxin-antitoxin system|nr:hypothetical protein [Propionibacteriaceae bacterium]